MNAAKVLEDLKRRLPSEPECHQAVGEVLATIEKEYNEHPEFDGVNLIEHLCIPDRVYQFRITWMDDKDNVQANMGCRVQHNSATDPYKGGVRFHASVNLSILKFLVFEQTFRNSLTTLSIGGGKDDSGFSPCSRSNSEAIRFVQTFVLELWCHISPETNVPTGDIGVDGRKVGPMLGMYEELARGFTGTFTGKGREFGGSLIRPKATGYGSTYFLLETLKAKGADLKDKACLTSDFGSVAQYTAEKALEIGDEALAMSDSDGYVYDPTGIDRKKLNYIMELKSLYRGCIREYAGQYPGAKYVGGAKPWDERADIALPFATRGKLNNDHAHQLVVNGCIAVSRGVNTPSVPEAIKTFQDARILHAPGKAANAGGVFVSSLEMAQSPIELDQSNEEADEKLKSIMKNIHVAYIQYGTEEDGCIDYVRGASTAKFMRVARAMMAQGIL